MTFRDRIVVREIEVRALVLILDDFEALMREIEVPALVLQNHPKSIHLFDHSENNFCFDNNELCFTKRHFSN
jgi:hypothetical protein